jgi:asparagine synthase (glutamine-hydrolysing)
LDTRMILAWQKPSPGSIPCYTFAGGLRECRDVQIARKVAKACGQSHEIIPIGNEFLSQFPRYAERTVHITDGCTGVYHSPDLYLNEIARQVAPVRMTGNYGDQALRHQTVFRPGATTPGLFSPDLFSDVAAAEQTYKRTKQEHALTVAVMRQTSWHYQGLLALESSQLAVRTPFLDNDLVRALYQAQACTLANNNLRVRLIGDGSAALRRIRTDLGFAGTGGPIVEAFSSRYQRFTMRAEFAYDYGMPQWLAMVDHGLSSLHLERVFLGRHKFSHFRIWYRDALASYVREMLLDSRTLSRPYLRRSAVEEIVRGHLTGNRNYTAAIHQILTLEHLHRLFLDAK